MANQFDNQQSQKPQSAPGVSPADKDLKNKVGGSDKDINKGTDKSRPEDSYKADNNKPL